MSRGVLWLIGLSALFLSSCGPLYTGLEGISHVMPEDKVVKCPYCRKQISDQDKRCMFCGRDVQFDLGTGALDKEINQAYEESRRS